MAAQEQPVCDHDCSPRDSVDALLESWALRRPDLDFGPVAVITRLARVRGHIDAELESVFRAFGLTPPDFAALVTLARIIDTHGVSQHRLADELGLTPGTISVRIDRLVDRGLAERKADPDSKRNTLVALTAQGRELFERVTPTHLANEQRLLAALSDSERQLLADLLRKLLVEFEGSRPAPTGSGRLGLVVSPAHVTIGMRAAVGLPPAAGLLVRSVEPDSPAARADLQPGDVLSEADGRELRSSASLYAAIREARAGSIQVTLLRGNEQVHTSLALDPGFPIDGRSATACGPGHRAEHAL
jgi:DNA-binding MarR family transcriptional regulator